MSVKFFLIFFLSFFLIPIIFVYGDSESENGLLLNKGIEHFGQEEYEQAISYFDQILEKDPNHVEALYNKGNTLSKTGKFNQAIPFYEKVLNLDPKKYIAKLKLEEALLKVTEYKIGSVDGVLEITVHDSKGGLIAFLKTNKIKAIDHEIVKNLVDGWPTTKVINKNDQNFAIHQQEFVTLVEHDTIFGFHELPFSENVDFPLATTWHYQIPVQKGDVVSYLYSIFRPVS